MARRKPASDTPITDELLAPDPSPRRQPRKRSTPSASAAGQQGASSPEDQKLRQAARDVGQAGGQAAQKIGASDGAGALLALLVWCWVALPMLEGGPIMVKDVLRAKFFNKDSKGADLP